MDCSNHLCAPLQEIGGGSQGLFKGYAQISERVSWGSDTGFSWNLGPFAESFVVLGCIGQKSEASLRETLVKINTL